MYVSGFSKILLSLESAIFLSIILTTAGSNDAQTVALHLLVLQINVKLLAFVVAIRYDRTSPAEVLMMHSAIILCHEYLNSCAFIWYFSAKEVNFVHILRSMPVAFSEQIQPIRHFSDGL